MRHTTGFVDLTDFVRKTHLGAADKRISDVVAAHQADYRAWVGFRVWLTLATVLEAVRGFARA